MIQETLSHDEIVFYNKHSKLMTQKSLNKLLERAKTKGEFYWTNTKFGSKKYFFGFNDTNVSIYKTFKSIKNDDLVNVKCIAFELFLKFELSIEDKQTIKRFFSLRYNGCADSDNIFLDSKAGLINYLIKHRSIDRFDGDRIEGYNDLKKIIKATMDDELPEKEQMYTVNTAYNVTAYHILKVYEVRFDDTNYRLAVSAEINKYYNPDNIYRNNAYRITFHKETAVDYNYIDENKLFFENSNKTYFFDIPTNQYNNGRLIVNLALIKTLMGDIINIFPGEAKVNVITPQIIRFYENRIQFNLDDGGKIRDDIDKQYAKLLKAGRTVKINEILINKKSISIEGELFSIKYNAKFFDVVKNFHHIKTKLTDETTRYDFNALYETILRHSSLSQTQKQYRVRRHYYNHSRRTISDFDSMTFVVNGMRIRVHKEGTRIHINNIFCREADVFRILNKAICYADVKEFNRFIKDVSYIGMDIKNIIANGVVVQLKNPVYRLFQNLKMNVVETTSLRFSFSRDLTSRSKMYLCLNDNKYPIASKVKFREQFNVPTKHTSLSRLRQELSLCIKDLDSKTLLEIVDNGIVEGRILQERGEKLVKETIEDTKAKFVEINISGNTKTGYQLVGLYSGTKFFIDKGSLDVYRFSGTWNRRCVVDDPRKNRIFEDRLANRLINVYNENKSISTL